jgi:tetratricopeptide (TPR) repeat protein
MESDPINALSNMSQPVWILYKKPMNFMTPEIIIIISLSAALLAVIIFTFTINRAKNLVHKDLATTKAELDRAHSQAATLHKRIRELDSRTYLSEFKPLKLYTLLACSDLDLDGKTVIYFETRDQVTRQMDWNAGLTYLKVLEGVDEGTVFYLPYVKATLGRESFCAVSLNDESCSHLHGVIEYIDVAFVLRDNNSTNGTFCNDNRISEKTLEFGDRITIGDTTLLFTCEGFELKDTNPHKAIEAFEKCLERQPHFLAALKNLALLLEHDIGRTKEAQPLWDRIKKLETGS